MQVQNIVIRHDIQSITFYLPDIEIEISGMISYILTNIYGINNLYDSIT